nr:MBL fold metallo-hydrolase [Actinomycetes bacterium]
MSGRPLIGSSMPWAGGATSDLAECVLAPNPSAWTLDGTNTWIVGEASGSCIIIDPGPLSGGHDIAISDALERRNNRATAVVLTHSHIDHAEGAHELARYLGVP